MELMIFKSKLPAKVLSNFGYQLGKFSILQGPPNNTLESSKARFEEVDCCFGG